MSPSLFPPYFPDPKSKFQQLIYSSIIGFFNGWLISVMTGVSYIYYTAPEKKIQFINFFSTLLYVILESLLPGALIALLVFPLFYITVLHKVMFWRMWLMTFPLMYAVATFGCIKAGIIGGYIGCLLGLIIVSIWFY